MSLASISESVESFFVTFDGGFNKTIEYRKKGQALIIKVNALVAFSNKEDKKNNSLRDFGRFMSLFLDFEPKQGDTINNEWIVDNWQGDNPYDVECMRRVDTKHTPRKRGR